MTKKKKTLLMLSISLFSIALVSLGTYAMFTTELLTGDSSISTGQVKMSYSESNEITLNNVVPTSDEKGTSSTDYFEFKVNTYIKTNNEKTMNYNIVLEPLDVDSSYTKFNDSDIKLYLTKVENNTETFVTGFITIADLNQYILKSQEETFNKGNTEHSTTYRLRTWLDYNFDASKINNKTYSYKFRVNVNNEAAPKKTIDESGANEPKLLSNMIPVYYDSKNDVWRKADEDQLEEYTYKLGDLNNDGLVDGLDLGTLWSTNCYGKKANTKKCIAGDIDGDGFITSHDKELIQSSEYYNKKATVEKTGYVKSDNSWYDYNNKMWANAVTVTSTNRETYLKADAGTEISMDDINTMWVWIPRYTYTYLNTNTPQEIQIRFESGTNSSGTIKCVDTINQTDSDGNKISETCTNSTNNNLVVGTSTYTHPAFTFGDQELTGIWVGKFENSAITIPTSTSVAEQTIIIKPNVESLRYTAIYYMFRNIRQMEKANNEYGFEQSNSTKFNNDGILTGDTNNIDTHMIKNIEWGAVAYLSHSKYGINKKVAINSANTHTTGCGPQSEGSTSSGSTCNSYTTILGQSASTTGNVYGVYDMNGGAFEFVMSNSVRESGDFNTANYGNNDAPQTKYYDSYTKDNGYLTYTRGRLGDATKEMAPVNSIGGWYSCSSSFACHPNPFFDRGGSYSSDTYGNVFSFGYTTGLANANYSSRSVLSILK